jgi:8-oxo-dGTP pyrophosphatase MutT (NUDIX family)
MQLGPLGHYDFTVEELRRLAAERLEQDIHPSAHDLHRPSGRGDHDLNPGVTLRPLRSAAVLLGIVERAGEARVVLTQRTEQLPTHAGQIALPGGKVDDADPGPVEAALRESREEIGLEDELVRVIGMLDTYQTGTGYRILPVVGLVSDAFEPRPEPREVAEVFEVPLAFLMNPDNHQRHSREWQGARRYFYAMPYQHRYIWGATAGILRNLYDRVYR